MDQIVSWPRQRLEEVKIAAKRNWLLLLFTLLHTLILVILFNSSIYNNSALQDDIRLFFDYSSEIVNGLLPYQDFTVEYPPMALAFFTLPRLFASSLSTYHIAFVIEILIFDVLGIIILAKLSQRLGLKPVENLTIYTVILLAIGPIMVYRYDIIPAVIVLQSLYFFSRQKYGFAWVLLAVGVMTKVYPLVIAPVFLLYQVSQRHYRKAVWGVVTFAAVLAVFIIAGLLLSPQGFWNSFSLQLQRGLHADSTYSSLLLLGKTLGLVQANIQIVEPTPLSVDVVSPLAGTLARIAQFVVIAALASLYWLYFRRAKSTHGLPGYTDQRKMLSLIKYSFLCVLVFMLTSNVLSPQFLIWLLPVIPIVTHRWRYAPWLLFTIACILTYYLFPTHYNDFAHDKSGVVYILLGRNLLLIALACLFIEWKRSLRVYRGYSSPVSHLKPLIIVFILVIFISSLIYTQSIWSSNIASNNSDDQIPDNIPYDNNFDIGILPSEFPDGSPLNRNWLNFW
jgi:uncharacterized membrane protein